MNSTDVPRIFVPLVLTCWRMKPYFTIFSLLVTVDASVSLPSNIWVVWLLLKGKGGCVISDFFFFNMVITELIISPSNILCLSEVLDLPPLITATINFLCTLANAGRPLAQCCICVERYMAVVHPITFLKYRALKYKLPCLAAVWLAIIVLCLLNVFTLSYHLITAIFISTLTVDSFCSFSILRVLRQPRPGDGEKDEMNLMKKRAFITVLCVQLTMVFHYFPMVIASVVTLFFSDDYGNCIILPYAYCFSYFANFVHPLLYISRVHKIATIDCCKRDGCNS